MSFLVGVAASVLEWLLSKFGVEVFDWIKAYRAKEEAKSQAKADGQAIANAKTEQEQDSALQKAIDDTFSSKP